MIKTVRPLCVECKAKPRAYAYRKNAKIYWRRLCDACNRKKTKKRVGGVTALQRSGYKNEISVKYVDSKHNIPLNWMCSLWMEIYGIQQMLI